MIDEQI